jgi:transposase
MTHRRQFTAAFNAQVVLELLSGAKSSAERCREHQLAASVLAASKSSFLARAASIFEGPDRSSSQETRRIAELERLVGRLTLANDILQEATGILHTRSKTHGRSSRCAARTIPCVRSAASWNLLAAVMITDLEPALRRRGAQRSYAWRRHGQRMASGGSPPCCTVKVCR